MLREHTVPDQPDQPAVPAVPLRAASVLGLLRRRTTFQRVGSSRGRRLALHAAGLLLVLVAATAVTGPGTGVTSDEGGGAYQAVLVDRGRWTVPPTLPELDPEGVRQPFLRAAEGARGRAPYGKHPLYPAVLALARQAAPVGGLVAVSVLGTWLAALAAALLAEQIRTGAGPPALWLVGALSPLAVDATWVLAHAPAAATGAATVLAAERALRHPSSSPRRLAGWLAAAAVAAGLTVGLRTEGLFLVAALAVGIVVCRRPDRRSLLVAAAVLAGGAAARLLEVAAMRAILGSAMPVPAAPAADRGFLAARRQAFEASWLEGGAGDGLLLVAVGLLVVAAVAHHRRFPAAVLAALGAAAAGLTLAWLAGGPELVPGLLPATAWLVAGAVVLGRRAVAPGLPRLLAVTTVVAALGILAIQYSFGGGVEWGGRFYAILLPGAGALVSGAWPPDRQRRRQASLALAISLAVVAGLTSTAGVLAVRREHARTDGLERNILAAAALAPPGRPADPDPRPVVFSDRRLWPQLVWRSFDRVRWVTADPSDLTCALVDLRAAGFSRIVVTSKPLAPLVGHAAEAGWREDPATPQDGFARVLVPSPSAAGGGCGAAGPAVDLLRSDPPRGG